MATDRAVLRARWGVTLLFWLNGVGFSSLVPRYPELKAALGLDELSWGHSLASPSASSRSPLRSRSA